LGKSQITKADNAKKLLGWKPNNVEEAIVDTAKKYKATRGIN
jgi:nucleoside-diphosphate-sugar epimerase